MKIVIDTNVFISAVFFGGLPLKVLQSVISKQNDAYISPEIWEEYKDVIERMTNKYPSRLKQQLIDEVFKVFKVIIPSSKISICRDHDDDKFISCAIVQSVCISYPEMMIFYHLEMLKMSSSVHHQNS